MTSIYKKSIRALPYKYLACIYRVTTIILSAIKCIVKY